MFTRILLLLGLLGILNSTNAVTITKCKPVDVDCLKLSAQALVPVVAEGISEFGMKSLDPLSIKSIDGSQSDLKLIASDVVVTGLKGCNIDRLSLEPSKINLDLLCSVNVKGDYEIKGKILLLAIDGKGNLNITLTKVLISVQADYKIIELNGKKHWDVTNWAHSFDLKDRAHIELTNLFAGSEKLTQAMKEMVGESSNQIVTDVGPPIVKAIAAESVDTINHLFHHMSVEELIIE